MIQRQICEHPIFDAEAIAAQDALWSLQGRRGAWFCGAYFGSGFHEDGLQAGLAVAEALGGVRRPWRVANESGRIKIGGSARRDQRSARLMTATDSALYIGKVTHRRLRPRRHFLAYRTYALLIDLDELPALDRRLRLFSHNAFNLFSFFDRDYGSGGASSLRAQIEAHGRADRPRSCRRRRFGF